MIYNKYGGMLSYIMNIIQKKPFIFRSLSNMKYKKSNRRIEK